MWLSSAVIAGWKEAKGRLLGVIDADLSHDPAILPDMIYSLLEGGADIALGSRYAPGGGVANWPWFRRFTSWVAIMLGRPICPARDVTSGYLLMKREVIEGVELNPIGFKINLEVMIKQMMKRVIVTDSGDTDLNVGVQLSLNNITKINRDALLTGKTPAQFKPVLLGISKASVETDSFLSAASFQETTKVLTDATIKGKVDHLIGLKENVIIGKLIPAGTGCTGNRPQNELVKEKAKELRDKRLARMHENEDEEFDKIVGANSLDEEASLHEDAAEAESILGGASLDAESIDIHESDSSVSAE